MILKICVCSDSHGNAGNLDKVLRRESPDVLLFLGDGLRDVEKLRIAEPCRVFSVSGNCDLGRDLPELRLLTLEGVRVLLVHGHRHGVKSGLLRLGLLAQEQRADVVVYGHTHIPASQWVEGTLLLCPGSVGGARCSYAVLNVEQGRFDFALKDQGDL